MKQIGQIALLILFFLWGRFTYASNETATLDDLAIIESLVVSQPEKALASILMLKKSKEPLISAHKVKLIRHEVLANVYLNRHKLALIIIEGIKDVANVESNKQFLWQYYNLKAIVYWHMDRTEDSLSFHLKAYDVVKTIEAYREYQALSEGDIGYSLTKLGFYEKAIPYFESEIALSNDNIANLATSYNNLGEAYLGLKNYPKSLELLEKSLAMRLKHQLIFHSSYSYQNLGLLYFAQNNYKLAEAALNKAIDIRKKAGFIKGLLVSQLLMVELYIATERLDLAAKEIEIIINKAKSQNNDTSLSKAYYLQRLIFVNSNDFRNAYYTTIHYEQSLEKVVSRKTSEKLASFLNSSEAIAKELNIIELEKNAEIKELQVNNERQKAKIVIGFSFIIVLFLMIFLWGMQKSKKIISKSNTDLSSTLAQLKETQEMLIKSGKMSALTTLVSRMAHQINTPLGIAVTGVSHLHEKTEHFDLLVKRGSVKKSEIDALITDLNKASVLSLNSMDKVAGLISQFKMISDSLEQETLQEFEVYDVIAKRAEIILMLLKQDKPVITISGSKEKIVGYPEGLNKVFSQLITNSIDHAFEDTPEPKVDIDIAKIDGYMEITYQDNGKGIDSDIVNDVFEPFYTTTMGNTNLGLGLSIVYNLVVQLMQGTIQCKANKDEGIMFCIRLPLSIETV